MRLLWLLPVIVLLLAAGAHSRELTDEERGREIFRRCIKAREVVTFEGRKTFISWSREKSRSFMARVWQDGARKRVEYLSTESHPRRIIIFQQNDEYHFDPRTGRLVHCDRGPRGEDSTFRLNLALRNYRWKLEGMGLIAGRSAYRISAYSRVNSLRTMVYWIDAEQYLILRQNEYNYEGDLVSTSFYTTIEFDGDLSGELFLPIFPGTVKREEMDSPESLDPQSVPAIARFNPLLPDRLPGGFILEEVFVEEKGKERIVRAIYTDGLETLTLFQSFRISNKPRKIPGAKVFKDGSLDVQSIEVSGGFFLYWRKDNLDFILLGGLPRKFLLKVASFICAG
jgi:hypothetical protein